MKHKINLQTAPGLEDTPNAECADLRPRIREARDRGDTERLAQLQADYRAAAHGAVARTTSRGPAARRTSPLHRAESAPPAHDPKREIVCRIARFNVLGPWGDRDGNVDAWGYFRTGCFDDWLARHSPADLPFSLEHESLGSLVWWRDLWVTPDVLWGVAVVERGAEDVLEYADTIATGASVGVGVVRSTERMDVMENGLPIFDAEECNLLDAGPVADPADSECWIISVRGKIPWQRQVAEKHERHVQLAERGTVQTERDRPPWRPRFAS